MAYAKNEQGITGHLVNNPIIAHAKLPISLQRSPQGLPEYLGGLPQLGLYGVLDMLLIGGRDTRQILFKHMRMIKQRVEHA